MKPKEREYDYLSDCCGAPPRGNGDIDSSDMGFCPECREHCEYGYFDSDGNMFSTEEDAINSDLANEQDLLKT